MGYARSTFAPRMRRMRLWQAQHSQVSASRLEEAWRCKLLLYIRTSTKLTECAHRKTFSTRSSHRDPPGQGPSAQKLAKRSPSTNADSRGQQRIARGGARTSHCCLYGKELMLTIAGCDHRRGVPRTDRIYRARSQGSRRLSRTRKVEIDPK